MLKSKSCVIFSLFLSVVFLLTLSSCNEDTPSDEAGKDTPDSSSASLSSFQFSEAEKDILEKITNLEFENITEKNLLSVKKIYVAGTEISRSQKRGSFSPDGFYVGDTFMNYGDDIGASLSVLQFFTNLEYLEIYFCESLTDVSFLEKLTNLEYLDITMSGVKDFSVLEKLDKLTSLKIYCSPVEAISFSDSNALTDVRISNGSITSLEPFAHLTGLKELSIRYNKAGLDDTGVISSLNNLESLELIAPGYDLSFFDDINAPGLSALALGGFDNIDLTKINTVSKKLNNFGLHISNYTNLEPLDSLPGECYITVVLSENCIHGKRTTDGDDRYSYSDRSHDVFDWYYEK